MIPRLLKNDATDFSVMGFGAMTKAVSCIVTEELGVAPTLEMSVLVDDPTMQNVTVGCIITAIPNKRDVPQAFIIEEITKPIDGIVTIYATHIAQHRGKLIPVKPFTASNLDDALSKMVTNSMETNPFTLVRDSGKNNVTATMSPTVPHSFRELMGGVSGSILDTYRGEWAYDNFTLTLYNKRGRDNGARVMYGRNMSDFTLEEQFNWDGSATGVIGYWVGETGTVISDIQYSDYKDLYPYNKTVCMDFSDKFEEQPTKAQLNAYAVEWINGKGLYGASVDVAYEHINVEGGADVGIGDVVHIYNGTYNFEMESRIVGLEFDVLSEEYTNVTIGEQRTTLNEAISNTVTPQENVESEILAKVAATYETKAEGATHVIKTGDTMTGALIVKKSGVAVASDQPDIDITTTPSSEIWRNAFIVRDKNERTYATVETYHLPSGIYGVQLLSTRTVNNTTYQNRVRLGIDPSGNRSVDIAKDAWLTALDLTPTAVSATYTSNVSAAGTLNRYYRMGRLIVLCFNLILKATTAAGQNFVTGLPKPIGGQSLGFSLARNGAGNRFYISADGDMRNDDASIPATWYNGSITYISAT